MAIIDRIKDKARSDVKRIVLPEGDEPRTVQAAAKIVAEGTAKLTLLGDPAKIKAVADAMGFASDMKAYKENPTAFGGSVADVSMFLRVAVTGRMNSPDMYSAMQILGKDRVFARIDAMLQKL